MSKLFVIAVSLLCASLHEIGVVKTTTVGEDVKLQNSHSHSVVINSHLYIVATNSTHLLVDSTAAYFKPCAIEFKEHVIQLKIQATVVDDKIIVWGIRAIYESDMGIQVDHTVLIVDPYQCSFKAVTTFEEERTSYWFDPLENLARVVTYNDSFDVFYPSLQTCAPCRYSIDGKIIDLQYQLDPETVKYGILYRIQSFNEPGHENAYVYSCNLGGEMSVIALLDVNFRVVKQTYLNHRVDVIAINPIVHSGANVCDMTAPTRKYNTNCTIYCDYFDNDLRQLFTIRSSMLEEHMPNAPSLNVNSRGGLSVPNAIKYLETWPEFPREKFAHYLVDLTGRILDVAIVYELTKYFYDQRKSRGFFIDKNCCNEDFNDGVWCNDDECK